MRSVHLPAVASILLLCGASSAALATDPPARASLMAPSTAPSAPSTAPATTPAAATAAPSTNFVAGLGRSADSATLEQLSGGTDVSNRITLHGDVSNNNADHNVSGNNAIEGGSFSGSVGLPMVIQNSGNNVLIQNATIVSVQFQP